MIIEELNLLKAISEARCALDSGRDDLNEFAHVVLSLGHAWLAYKSSGCGTGAGGFQPGNTCAGSRNRRLQGKDARRRKRMKKRGPRSKRHAQELKRQASKSRLWAKRLRRKRNELRSRHAGQIKAAVDANASQQELFRLARRHEEEISEQRKLHREVIKKVRDRNRSRDVPIVKMNRSERAAARAKNREALNDLNSRLGVASPPERWAWKPKNETPRPPSPGGSAPSGDVKSLTDHLVDIMKRGATSAEAERAWVYGMKLIDVRSRAFPGNPRVVNDFHGEIDGNWRAYIGRPPAWDANVFVIAFGKRSNHIVKGMKLQIKPHPRDSSRQVLFNFDFLYPKPEKQ